MKGFIFDLDGTIYLDEEMIEGAADAILALKKRGDKVIFLTNKSIATRQSYLKKLNRMGIQASIDEIINSNFITAKYLGENIGENEKVYVIGEPPLFEELVEQNIEITDDPKNARFVVVGWDRNFDYNKLNTAFQAWKYGAKVIATNPDRTCPIKDGEIPDCGAIIGAIEGATGQRIDMVTGKPSKLMANYVVDKLLKLPPENCYMVGDRIETDILMGNEAGLNSVLVMTGITTEEILASSPHKPKYVLKSVKEILTL